MTTYDIAIIGAGAVGCAAARAFARAGARVVVLEKGSDILSGASKANSAILHTGFDAPPGSLELELVKAGRAEYLEIHRGLGLSVVETGALVCAWAGHEVDALEAIAAQGRENGIAELRVLDGAQARRLVPGLSSGLLGAVEVMGEHVIDPWSAPLAYLTEALALGASFQRNTEVLSGAFDGEWRLQTTQGEVRVKAVVNAAGLWGDVIDARLGLAPDFTIKPRKGQFIVLDKAAAVHVPKILLPVPNEITKGIVICPTAFGNVLVGPTAEEQDDRTRATVQTETLQMLKAHGARLVPALEGIEVTAVYEGTAQNAWAITAGVIVVQAVLTLYSTRLAQKVNSVAVMLELGGMTALVVLLFAVGHWTGQLHWGNLASTGKIAAEGYFSLGTLTTAGPWVMGSLLGASTIVGFESAANIAEETHSPETVVPRAMWQAVLSVGVIGMLFLVAVTLLLPDPAGEISATPIADVIASTLGSVVGNLLLVMVVSSIFACGLVIMISGSRLVWAMSRDERFPAWQLLHRVDPGLKTPVNATIFFAWWARSSWPSLGARRTRFLRSSGRGRFCP